MRKFFQFLACAALATVVTTAAVFVDGWLLRGHKIERNLRWARFVVSHVENLTLTAQRRRVKDPLQWAVDQLVETSEGGVLRVYSTKVSTGEKRKEIYRFDPSTGDFDYMKSLLFQDGQGVRVRIENGYEGFLGARTPWTNDITVLLFCAVIFWVFFLALRLWDSNWRPISVGAYVSRWSEEVYLRFKGLGGNLREFVREARDLIHTAYQAHETLLGLEARVNRGSEAARSVTRAARDARSAVETFRTEITDLRNEAEKYGVKALERRAVEVANEFEKLRTALTECERRVAGLDGEIALWREPTHRVRSEFGEIVGRAGEMRSRIGRVTLGVADYHRQVKELREELSPGVQEPNSPVVQSGSEPAEEKVQALPKASAAK